MNKKTYEYTVRSIIFLVLGLFFWLYVAGQVKNFDKYHWVFLTPLPFFLAGTFIGIRGVGKSLPNWRILAALAMLANIGLAVITFIGYSFSYWQF